MELFFCLPLPCDILNKILLVSLHISKKSLSIAAGGKGGGRVDGEDEDEDELPNKTMMQKNILEILITNI